jgi:hypothetical protein
VPGCGQLGGVRERLGEGGGGVLDLAAGLAGVGEGPSSA